MLGFIHVLLIFVTIILKGEDGPQGPYGLPGLPGDKVCDATVIYFNKFSKGLFYTSAPYSGLVNK